MALGAPFVVVEAVGANPRLTAIARFQAATAMAFLHAHEPMQPEQHDSSQPPAHAFAFAANRIPALLTGIAFILARAGRNRRSCRLPQCELHIRAFGVVGSKHATRRA